MTSTETVSVSETLARIYATAWPPRLLEVLLAPDGMGTAETLEAALEQIDLPSGLLPLAVIDESSVAVVALDDLASHAPAGTVFRWFVSRVDDRDQLAIVDVDPLLYIASVDEELASRAEGLDRMLDVIGPAYEESYIAHEKRPRDFVVRPVRIACQNVIVGLAAIAQDSNFDGLSVPAWQTCEVPHVATHEGNRALAALMLCDAFQNGGTMELRFDRRTVVTSPDKTVAYAGHPEGQVPASLRRYGRTVGVPLGADDPAAISPREARELFLAVTPMSTSLRDRVIEAAETKGVTPERACFALLSQTWREIEVDFLLACSAQAGSILEGGADWFRRGTRQAEIEACRAAIMAGMYFRRLNGRDNAGADTGGVRVVEDVAAGVEWEVLPESGAIVFRGCDLGSEVPWLRSGQIECQSEITVLPRSLLTADVISELDALQGRGLHPVAALPLDVATPGSWAGVSELLCKGVTSTMDRGCGLERTRHDRHGAGVGVRRSE